MELVMGNGEAQNTRFVYRTAGDVTLRHPSQHYIVLTVIEKQANHFSKLIYTMDLFFKKKVILGYNKVLCP